MSAPCFVYRKVGGKLTCERVHDASTLAKRLSQGWSESKDCSKPTDPVSAPEPAADDVAPTRDELEAKATELGIKVDGRWSDKRLMLELTKALEGG